MIKEEKKIKVMELTKPPITTYPSIANVLSLVWDKNEAAMPWFCDHFIQLIVRPNHADTFGDFYDHADLDNYFRLLYGMPGLGWMRVNSECAHFTNFTEYIEYQIEKGYCLEACLDRFYLSFTKFYRKKHFIHSSFIYGYDKTERKVFVADFWEGGKYEKKIADYEEINESMNNDYIINLFRCESRTYTMNSELLKRYLSDYYYSIDSFGKYEFSNQDYNKGVVFGLAYYDFLFDNIREREIPDIRMYHILYDHKVLMKYRLAYLKTLLNFNEADLEYCIKMNETIIEESANLRNLVIKNCIDYSEENYHIIKDKIMNLKKMDKKFVKKMMEII